MKTLTSLMAWLTLSTSSALYGGTATWELNPGSDAWTTATNWTPNTVPNGSADTATFDVSNVTSVSLSPTSFFGFSLEVNSIVFSSNASGYTIDLNSEAFSTVTISGAGIINDSGITQTFAARVLDRGSI
ncbi:MAG TPA: hypothetical protein VGM62_00670, partial [Chthoniobacterales bacterium]